MTAPCVALCQRRAALMAAFLGVRQVWPRRRPGAGRDCHRTIFQSVGAPSARPAVAEEPAPQAGVAASNWRARSMSRLMKK